MVFYVINITFSAVFKNEFFKIRITLQVHIDTGMSFSQEYVNICLAGAVMLLLPSTSCVQAVVLKLSPVSNKAAPMRYVIQSFECSDIMLSLLSPKSI